jgi:spore coat protein CotF
MLAPDSAATSKVRAFTGADRDAQILMGELPENLNKVDTSLDEGTNFLTYGSFLTLLANIPRSYHPSMSSMTPRTSTVPPTSLFGASLGR